MRLKYAIEYKVGKYRIRLNFWLLIIFLIAQTLLNELGFWQLERAKEKQYRLYQLEKGGQSVVTDLTQIDQSLIAQFQSVELQLELYGYDSLYLDSKINNKRPGYHVLNIAKDSSSGKYLLINRGWEFAGIERGRLPEVELPPRQWLVQGRVYPIAEEAIKTADAKVEKSSDGMRLPVMDRSVVEKIESHYGIQLEQYLIRLNQQSEAALETDWKWTNMSADKHLAYAVQWFALALALLVISLVVCIKKGE